MRLLQYLTYGFAATSAVQASIIPEENSALSILARHGGSSPRSENIISPSNALAKRKGGGGKGGGGSSSGGKSSSGGNTGNAAARTSPNSNAGGATKLGSGAPRSFGGGGYYGGGASTPYPAGKGTPKGLIAGAVLAPAALLLVFPGLWLYSAYPYYLNQYRFYNESYRNATQQGMNQTLPVTCLCQDQFACGCDQNDDPRYINELVGNGSYDALNKTLVTVSDVNGTRTLFLNGTLPNGTTSPGGQDDAGINLKVGKWAGFWVVGMIVLSTVTLL